LPFAINFSRPFRCASLDRKKFPAHPGHLRRAVLVYALAASGSQTGDGFKSWKPLMPNLQKLFFGTFLFNSN
ncbi:hypothetical protein ACK1YF_004140, partial [Salmonella enterica]